MIKIYEQTISILSNKYSKHDMVFYITNFAMRNADLFADMPTVNTFYNYLIFKYDVECKHECFHNSKEEFDEIVATLARVDDELSN